MTPSGPNGWSPGTLKDLVFFQRGFDITQAEQRPGPYPVVSSSGITSYHDEFKATGPRIVIGRKGTLGSIHYIPENLWPHDTTLWSKDLRGHDPRFIYYYLHTIDFKRFDVGNSNPTLNRNHIHDLAVKIPPDRVQLRIRTILSRYDDLIENNMRRIKLLEEAARLLYEEWFVRLRFPGHEHTPIHDGIPEEWEVVSFGDILAELETGNRPKGGAREEGVPSVGAENVLGIGQYNYDNEKYVPEDYFAAMRRGKVRSRDLLLYKDGAYIGRSSYFGDGFPHLVCAVNEHVFLLRSTRRVGQNFLYFWMRHPRNVEALRNLNANAAQPGISQGRLKALRLVIPSQRLVDVFNEYVEPTVQLIFKLAISTRRLTEARDLLLPRLMSGELAV